MSTDEYTIIDNIEKLAQQQQQEQIIPEEIDYGELTWKNSCKQLFKHILTSYKAINTSKSSKQEQMLEMASEDYALFIKIQKYFKLLQSLIKYWVISEKHYYETTLKDVDIKCVKDLIDMDINFPKDSDQLLALFAKYPFRIDLVSDELFNIINMDTFDGLLILNKINPQFYFNTITDAESSEKILFFKDDVNTLWINITLLFKKLLKINIEIAKLS